MEATMGLDKVMENTGALHLCGVRLTQIGPCEFMHAYRTVRVVGGKMHSPSCDAPATCRAQNSPRNGALNPNIDPC
ncbi:uncharacterized protein DS421_13g402490 [Arachis hypogaea]|nr:uncharacterized protein DS421_13g402490 [Arachis hypogaea]